MTSDGDINSEHLYGVVLKLPPIPSESLNITYDNECVPDENKQYTAESCFLPFAAGPLVNVKIEDARILASGEDVKTIIELSLNNQKAELDFKVGDTIGILPENDANEVTFLIHRLKLSEQSNIEYLITLKENNAKKKVAIPNHIPQKATLKYMFLHCIDIRSILKKILICVLSKYTEDAIERRQLEEISSREGSSLYNKHILEKQVSILDLLKQYPSCHPPVTTLIQHLPRLTPRPYSVSNSPLVDKNKIKICFSVIAGNNDKKGITTGWMEIIARNRMRCKDQNLEYDKSSELESINEKLNSLSINNGKKSQVCTRSFNIPIYLRKSTGFTLPTSQDIPIIMIGPGTGVAPFIGFLEERRQLKINNPNRHFGSTQLYYGCRYSEKDFIYKKELDDFVVDGTLSRLRVSHSRDESNDMKYVQDQIIADADDLVTLINQKSGVIFVCGDLNTMGKQVKDSFIQCFKTAQGVTDAEAEIVLTDLKNSGRYVEDIWT